MGRFTDETEAKGQIEGLVDQLDKEIDEILGCEELTELENMEQSEDIFADMKEDLEGSEGVESSENSGDNQSTEPIEVVLKVEISSDRMVATLEAISYDPNGKNNKIEYEEAEAKLTEAGVKYGINEELIRKFIRDVAAVQKIEAANGTPAIDGINGEISYQFETKKSKIPKERTDGTIDFKEISDITCVEEGDLLCEIIPPTEGENGTDVTGVPVVAKPGKPAPFKTGPNVTMSEDESMAYAAVSGMASVVSNTLDVKQIYAVSTDVGPITGNIRFNGAVNVKGNVLDGYSIIANGDIIVDGYIEGSFLSSKGNVVVKNGINGMKKGIIKADGDITVKFSEMTKLVAGGNVLVDYAINCDIRAGNSIVAAGKKASLIGGSYLAGKTIEAKSIGNDVNGTMDVQVIPKWEQIKDLEMDPLKRVHGNTIMLSDVNAGLKKLKSVQEKLSEEILRASKQNSFDDANSLALKKEKINKSREKLALVERELETLNTMKERLEQSENCEGCKIVVKDQLHSGARLAIGAAVLHVHRDTRGTFIESDRSLVQLEIV